MKITVTVSREQLRLLRNAGLIDCTDDAFAVTYIIERLLATTLVPMAKVGMLRRQMFDGDDSTGDDRWKKAKPAADDGHQVTRSSARASPAAARKADRTSPTPMLIERGT